MANINPHTSHPGNRQQSSLGCPLLALSGHRPRSATRPLLTDGVDQLDFLTGKKDQSNREHVIIYVGSELYGIKWRNYKMMNKEIDKGFADPTRSYGVPLMALSE